MKNRAFIIACVFALAIAGCTQRITDFTIISTKNVDLSRAATFERARNRVEGEDGAYWILFIPTGFPNLKEAIDRTIETTPGAVALVDGVAYSKAWYIILTGYMSYIVEGTPLIDPELAKMERLDNREIGKYNYCKYDRKGNIKEFRILSEEEYMDYKNKIIARK